MTSKPEVRNGHSSLQSRLRARAGDDSVDRRRLREGGRPGRDQGGRRRQFQTRRAGTVSGRHARGSGQRLEHQQPVRAPDPVAVRRSGRQGRDVFRGDRRAEPRQDARGGQEHPAVDDRAGRLRRVRHRHGVRHRRRPDVRAVLAQQPAKRRDAPADRLRRLHVQPERADAIGDRARCRFSGEGLPADEPPGISDRSVSGHAQPGIEQLVPLCRTAAVRLPRRGDRVLLHRNVSGQEEDPGGGRRLRRAGSLSCL